MLRQQWVAADDVSHDVVFRRKQQDLLPQIHLLTRSLADRARGMDGREYGFAPRASRCHLPSVRLEHEIARVPDLAVPKCVDHLLRPGGDQILLVQTSVEFSEQRRVMFPKGPVEDFLHLRVDVGLSCGPTVRPRVDYPSCERRRQRRTQRVNRLMVA